MDDRFRYYSDKSELPTTDENTFIATVPKGIKGRDNLFNALYKIFHFPYFGFNWDALFDCFKE